MPESRPARGHYAKNGNSATLTHGQPVFIDNFAGIAIKQQAVSWKEGLAAQNIIQKEEAFFVLEKGGVLVPAVAEAVMGDAIYIIAAENKLTKTSSGNKLFGRVYGLPGERGCPTGKMRVDLDAKDSM